MNLFNNDDEEIVCGGTSRTYDSDAKKTIESNDILVFDISTRLDLSDADSSKIFCFACKADKYSYVYLVTFDTFRKVNEEWAFIDKDIFPELNRMVKDFDLAKKNGEHVFTHGLPEDFGGHVRIKYASGEKISYSNNNSPVISNEEAVAFMEYFKKCMKYDKVKLPDTDLLCEIHYSEDRKDGYTKIHVHKDNYGKWIKEKESRYGNDVFNSKKELDNEVMDYIKKQIEDEGIIAYEYFPEKDYCLEKGKSITFVFDGNEKHTVEFDREVPKNTGNGLYNIELELAIKN